MICAAEGLKKICREYPSFSLCAECSLGLLQLFLALGNQNSWKFFFLKLGWYLDILSVLMFIFSFLVSYCLYKEYWAQEITTTEENSEFILAGCFVFPGKNTSVVLVGAARPLQWPLPILCLCGQELWGRWVSIWLHFFPSDSMWDPRAAPSWLLLAEHTMAGLRWQRCVRECDRGMSLSPQPLLTLSHCWELPAQHCSVQPKPFPGCHNNVPLIGDLSSTFLK